MEAQNAVSCILKEVILDAIITEIPDEITELPIPERPSPELIILSSDTESASDNESSDSSVEYNAATPVAISSPEYKNTEAISTKNSKAVNNISGVKPTLNAQYVVVKTNYLYNVYQSIKYGIWCSTASGNKTLDSLFAANASDGPVYLLLLYKGEFLFQIAEMISRVDYTKLGRNIWVQDLRDDGCFVGQIKIKLICNHMIALEKLREYGITKNMGFVTKLNYQNGVSAFAAIKNLKMHSESITGFFKGEEKKVAEGLFDGEKATEIFVQQLKKGAKLIALHRRVCCKKIICSEIPLCKTNPKNNEKKEDGSTSCLISERPIESDNLLNIAPISSKLNKRARLESVENGTRNAELMSSNEELCCTHNKTIKKLRDDLKAANEKNDCLKNCLQQETEEVTSLKKKLHEEKMKNGMKDAAIFLREDQLRLQDAGLARAKEILNKNIIQSKETLDIISNMHSTELRNKLRKC